MNTSKIKQYAPKARNDFIAAISKKANQLGIYDDKISEAIEVGGALQIEGKSFDIAYKSRRIRLIKMIEQNGFDAVIEKVAYSWFNRLCAIRYMELHDYLGHGFRVLSNKESTLEKSGSIEILDHAKDAADELGLNTNEIIDLQLAGNKGEELYRQLLLAQCHQLHKAMPFLFEPVDDETELLLPEGLTRTDSLIRKLVTAIPEEDWQEVEVIGWLYQFYISEKKDQVIGKVVKSEDIPAATQLFTPNWIVKYLVQNSVGRQWLQTYPDSSIKAEMEYYIEPAEQTDEVNQQLKVVTPDSIDPEDIKVLDPACGSGHILVEAYSLLREIYIERGYKKKNFPKLILENNIFGLDIDDRAAQLSGFALMMKAREDDRRIFTREIELNVMSLQSTQGMFVNPDDWLVISDEQERQGFLLVINDLLELFKQAKTFGSLIEVPEQIAKYLPTLERKIDQALESGDMFASSAAELLIPIVKQAKILALKYDVIVANPPYMGGKGMNTELKKFAKDNYPNSSSDLFAVYIESCLNMGVVNAEIGLVTPYVWMFISSYEKVRERIVAKHTLNSLIQLEYNAFSPACIPVCTFTISKMYIPNYIGGYIRLSDFKGHQNQAPKTLEAISNRTCGWFFEAKPDNFMKIQGSPIAYWLDSEIYNLFCYEDKIRTIGSAKTGMTTGDIDFFTKHWYEIDFSSIKFDTINRADTLENGHKWYPYNKGGKYRKWYGNNIYVVNWENDGYELRKFKGSTIRSPDCYFKPNISWSEVTSSEFSSRVNDVGFVFDTSGPALFVPDVFQYQIQAYMTCKLVNFLLGVLNPTLHFLSRNIENLPIPNDVKNNIELRKLSLRACEISKSDWNNYEFSWGFKNNPLINNNNHTLKDSYDLFVMKSSQYTDELKEIEEKVNLICHKLARVSQYFSHNVSKNRVTLLSNPYYRYGSNYTIDEELEKRFQSDTIYELISYSIGCMMGRYSLDREDLIYAHYSNKVFSEFKKKDAYNIFPADDDGIIPITDMEWFDDDATYRFKEFLIAVWGEETLQENLQFVADSLTLHAIKPKKDESPLETIRRYFSTAFFKQHLKTYKKRPIYWLFSSGKQKSFEALVYLHRYNESTLARMRTEYVTPLMGKYEARADSLQQQLDTATGTESRRIEKELKSLNNKQTELRTFDDKLKHYADMQIKLDLDDGVKMNYGKFGDLLAEVKAVTGKKPETMN